MRSEVRQLNGSVLGSRSVSFFCVGGLSWCIHHPFRSCFINLNSDKYEDRSDQCIYVRIKL